MIAMCTEDNMDSMVQLAESEVVAFGKVNQTIPSVNLKNNSQDQTDENILRALVTSPGNFSTEK